MSVCVTVIEHGYLRRIKPASSDSEVRIPSGDFDALRGLLTDDLTGAGDGADEAEHGRLFRLCSFRGEEALQVRNFVGVIEVPSGLQIEILPKIGGSKEKAREVLLRMLRATSGIPARPAYAALLRPVKVSILESFINEFLDSVNHLLKRGLVSGYRRRQQNQNFLKGRLLLSQHLMRNAFRADRFYVEYDYFKIDRAENRLIRSALEIISGLSQDPTSQRLCRELLFAFDDVPVSQDIRTDFDLCIKDRGLSHYSIALMWARLVLLHLTPLGSQGQAQVRALLFPMEKLFEKYVGVGLRKQLPVSDDVHEQVKRQSLVSHRGNSYFQLKPDFLVKRFGNSNCVLDAKWKLIDSNQSGSDRKYGISQSDMYQLYAYGRKYLANVDGNKVVCLVYPMTADFKHPLDPFVYETGHQLLVLPFDLERCQLVGMKELMEMTTKSSSSLVA